MPALPQDVRAEAAAALEQFHEPLVRGLASMLATGVAVRLPVALWNALAAHIIRAITHAVERSAVEPGAAEIVQLQQLRQDLLGSPHFFSAVYLGERVMLDELALRPGIGADTESWPMVTQVVRRAAYDVLAACSESAAPAEVVTDRLTTLPTRGVFEAVLGKEILRAARCKHPLAVIVCDVDHLSAVNELHGWGVGDLVLERVGILLRSFFRQLDWVARLEHDAFAVLLPETGPAAAAALAEGARAAVEERLVFRDHRSEQQVRTTVSAVVVTAPVVEGAEIEGHPLDAARLLDLAASSLKRLAELGGNRVETIGIVPSAATPSKPRRTVG